MAEFPMQGQGARVGASQIGTFTSYVGAVASLALMVGIGLWGYKVLSADVSGVPVVMAASDEPMRVAPEDPGGASAEHQGLAVNRVMAEGEAEKPADRLVLAPKPVQLTDEDQPGQAKYAAAETLRPVQPVLGTSEPKPEPLTPQMASIQALAEKLAAGAAPLAAPAPKAETVTPPKPVEVAAVATPQPVAQPETAAPESVVSVSLRPKMRPARRSDAVAAAVSAALNTEEPASAPEPEAAALTIPAGTRLVQLGAFDGEDVAEREWQRLSTRFGEYMGDKTRVIQRAKSGGRVFYRLRAMGFADLSDARRFCAALVAERADCIPVVAK